MKRQDNPDGKHGHVEREKIYKDVVKQGTDRHSEDTPKIVNFFSDDNTPLSKLQVEIRMKQCALKTGECYQKDCMNCQDYGLS